MSERLPSTTPTDIRAVEKITILFRDGSKKEIVVPAEGAEGFYKSENLGPNLSDHNVYIVNGLVRDTPRLELGL